MSDEVIRARAALFLKLVSETANELLQAMDMMQVPAVQAAAACDYALRALTASMDPKQLEALLATQRCNEKIFQKIMNEQTTATLQAENEQLLAARLADPEFN